MCVGTASHSALLLLCNTYRNEETQCLTTASLGSTQYILLGQSKRNSLSLDLGHLLKVALSKALLCSVRERQLRKELSIAVVFLDHKWVTMWI